MVLLPVLEFLWLLRAAVLRRLARFLFTEASLYRVLSGGSLGQPVCSPAGAPLISLRGFR